MKTISKISLTITGILLFSWLAVTASSASQSDVRQIQKDIRTMVKSMNQLDDKLTLKYTWPDIIEIAGGREKVLETIKGLRKNDEGNSYKYSELKFHKPVKFYRTGKKRFAVIPYLMTIKQSGKQNKTTKGEFYYLAVKNSRREKWTYVEGGLFFVLNIREFVDDFPQEVEFPRGRIISQTSLPASE